MISLPDDDRGIRNTGIWSIRVCAVMLVFYALYSARTLFVPVATALAFYLTLRPIVRQGKRIGLPAPATALGIIVGLLSLLGLATYAVIEPAQQTISETPRYVAAVKNKLSFITEKLREVDDATEGLTETVEDDHPNVPIKEKPVPVEIKQAEWASNLTYLSGTGNILSFLTICLALLYFLLATGDNLLRSIMRSLPDFTSRRRLIEVIEHVQEGLGAYLAQVSMINAGLGATVGLAMAFFGMPSPILWGVMAFAFNFIPILGAAVGAGIIFVVALVNFEPTYYAFLVAGTFVSLTSLEGQFITPSILGRSMKISPVLVFLSIVLWGWLWGIMGVFLSVPLLIAARIACEGYEGLMPIAMILGADVPQEPRSSAESTAVPEPAAGHESLAEEKTAGSVGDWQCGEVAGSQLHSSPLPVARIGSLPR